MVLRLVFHDAATYNAACGDGGANASVRLELERPENKGLKRGWRVIEAAMAGELDRARATWVPTFHLLPPIPNALTWCMKYKDRKQKLEKTGLCLSSLILVVGLL